MTTNEKQPAPELSGRWLVCECGQRFTVYATRKVTPRFRVSYRQCRKCKLKIHVNEERLIVKRDNL